MFSKLRQSFRRKSSRRRSAAQREPDGDGRSDAGTLRSRSVRSSLTSLTSFGSSASSPVSRERGPAPSADTQWQRSTPSVIESNRVMFNRQLHCDVMFVVGVDRALVGAHRFVLVSRSDVLYRMFYGPLAETGPVVIPDVTEHVFRQFLEFLYVDEVSLTADNVTPLHYLGRKYDVEPLVQQCLEFLHARLTCDNACSILEQAHCFDEQELYKASLEFIQENVKACLDGGAANDLCRDCFKQLLSMDDLDVSEQLLFKAVVCWAEASLEKDQVTVNARNVRHKLGSLLYLVRFPAMTSTVLRERVIPTEILTRKEVETILEYKKRSQPSAKSSEEPHTSAEPSNGPLPSAEPFMARGRQRVLRRFQNVSRVRCGSQSEAIKWTAAITFSCDRDFILHAIHVFSSTRESQLASVRFSILQGQDQIDLYNRMAEYEHTYSLVQDTGAVKTLTINVGPPLPLSAHVDYTLVLQADMAACFTGTDGMACVTCDDVSFRFRDARVKVNGTTVTEGQIPSFVFSVR